MAVKLAAHFSQVDVPDIPGPTVNFDTYQCVIYGFAHAKELKTLRRQLYSERLPPTKPKLASRYDSLKWYYYFDSKLLLLSAGLSTTTTS